MDKDPYIIYIGSVFTVEWYYDSRGKCPGLKYFLKSTEELRRKFLALAVKIAEKGIFLNNAQFRHEGDGIYAFKPMPDRYLSFFTDDRKIIVTNGFVKKQDKFPVKEKIRAKRLRRDYHNRKKEGKYYGNDL